MTTLTWFQRFDPVTKLLLILCLGLASFVIPTLTINWLLVFILFLLAISIGKLSRVRLKTLFQANQNRRQVNAF